MTQIAGYEGGADASNSEAERKTQQLFLLPVDREVLGWFLVLAFGMLQCPSQKVLFSRAVWEARPRSGRKALHACFSQPAA